MNLASLDASILGPAFAAGLVVLATHVPLGREVLKRGIVFIDLAVAQIAGLGVIVAHTLGWEAHGWGTQLAAVASALAGACLLGWMERRWGKFQEALIGAAFVLAATAGILLLAENPHGGERLRELLVGQILWVTWGQLLPAVLVSAFVLSVWFCLGARRVGRVGFYALFALAVTASVQLAGVYLVFASLIIPALAGIGQSAGRALLVGYAAGGAGYALGLVLSALLDLPGGAVIVWGIAAMALLGRALCGALARAAEGGYPASD
ncbi:MAG: metal ABC transporter permease [Gammaproteobacteria bacterium]|nr:metal ABC transporter permease [Gammaproteobacteria bacterium]